MNYPILKYHVYRGILKGWDGRKNLGDYRYHRIDNAIGSGLVLSCQQVIQVIVIIWRPQSPGLCLRVAQWWQPVLKNKCQLFFLGCLVPG